MQTKDAQDQEQEVEIVTNLFMTRNQPFQRLKCSIYGFQSEEVTFGLLQAAANILTPTGFPAAVIEKQVVCIGSGFELKIRGNYLKLRGAQVLKSNNENDLWKLRKLAKAIVTLLAENNGYPLNEGNKHFGGQPRVIGNITVYSAFEETIWVTPKGDILIALDAGKRWVQYLQDVISDILSQEEMPNQSIEEMLLDTSVQFPTISGRWSEGKVVRIIWDKIGNYEVEERSLYDYWLQKQRNFLNRYNIKLDPDDTPILLLDIGREMPYSYPAKVCRLAIDLTNIPPEIHEKGKMNKPWERFKAINKFSNQLFREKLGLDGVSIEFDPLSLKLDDPRIKEVFKIGEVHPPTLEFKNNGTVSIKKDKDIVLGLQQFGPYSGPKEINVHFFVHKPLEDIVDNLYEQLKKAMSELNLGTIRRIPRSNYVTIVYENGRQFFATCLRGASKLKQMHDSNIVALIILPKEEDSQAYGDAKRALGSLSIPSLCIKASTLMKLIEKEGVHKVYLRKIIAANLYTRILRPGEAAWLLKDPAGGFPRDKVTYVSAVDMSRDRLRKSETAADMVTYDAYGRILDSGQSINAKGEYLSSEHVKDWLFQRTASAIVQGETMEGVHPPTELIYLHDGTLKWNQVVEFKKGAQEAVDQLKESGLVNQDLGFVILSLIKRDVLRLFERRDGWKISNPPEGLYLIDQLSGEVHLVSSLPFTGTTNLIRLQIKSQSKKTFTPQTLVSFINDMRYLDAGSPYKQPKLPIVSHMVHNKANFSRFGEICYFPY